MKIGNVQADDHLAVRVRWRTPGDLQPRKLEARVRQAVPERPERQVRAIHIVAGAISEAPPVGRWA